MGLGSMIGSNALGALGRIEKAKLVFLEADSRTSTLKPFQKSGDDDYTFLGSSTSLKLAEGSLKKANNKLTNALAGVQNEILNEIYKEANESMVLDVHFNPSTISISAVGGGSAQVHTFGEDENNKGSASFTQLATRVDVSIQLLFDAVDRQDAFATDKVTGVVKSAANTAINIGKAVAGYEYTVLPQIEGLHGAVRASKVPAVRFCWGKIEFQGIITHLNTVYTMFNPVGNPIRATASLRITSTDVESIQRWRAAYSTLFSGDNPVITKKVGQTVSGILNI